MTSDAGCWWCGAPSTRLCDAVLGFERRASDRTLIMDEPHVCDAPLCDAHARQVGHVCGSGHDSLDRCPEHAGRSDEPVTEDAKGAVSERRAIRARALRSRLRLLPTKETT